MDKEAAEKATQTTRRAFVKSASQVAVTAPAVSLLLAGSTKMAAAQLPYFCPASPVQGEDCDLHRILDDFTFGSNQEDIDAINLGSNFNPFNGTNNLDDVVVP
jgi:hypothetical protein